MTPHQAPAVGVTGGIGAGKSKVCAILASLGALTVSADELAKRLLDTDPGIRTKITAAFGPSLYDAAGRIDRKALARKAFGDDTLLNKLNAIVHPRVTEELRRILRRERERGAARVVAVEAALIFEARIEGLFDYIVVVEAPEGVRKRRIAARDGASRSDIAGRMRAQLPPEELERRADFVIHNIGDLAGLRAKCEFVYRLLERMGPPPSGDEPS